MERQACLFNHERTRMASSNDYALGDDALKLIFKLRGRLVYLTTKGHEWLGYRCAGNLNLGGNVRGVLYPDCRLKGQVGAGYEIPPTFRKLNMELGR